MTTDIATADIVIARCFQLILVMEGLRLVLLLMGRGIFIYDRPKPLPPSSLLYDWAVAGGWPA